MSLQSVYTSIKAGAAVHHVSCLSESAVASLASLTSCSLLKLLSHLLFISGWTKNLGPNQRFF